MGFQEPESGTPMLMRMPSRSTQQMHQYLAATSVSLGAFCAGTVLSWTSPALPHILSTEFNSTNLTTEADLEHPHGKPGFTITPSQGALVGSMLTIGALVCAVPIGYLADKIGRKVTILGLAISFLINWVLICLADDFKMLLAARFFAGIGLGGICVVAPMYIGEISESSNRGKFGSFFQLFLSCGILFTCIVGYVTDWFGLTFVLGTAPIVFLATFFFMPETPTFLVRRNRMMRAEANLRKLRGKDCDVSIELKMIEEEVTESNNSAISFKDIVSSRANLKALIAVIGVLAFQQLCGINAMVFYTVNIFKAAGTSTSPFLLAIVITLVQVVVSYASIFLIERANRKFYLMSSSSGMLVCLAALGMFFHLKHLNINTAHLAFIPVGSTILYMAAFSFGYGPVPWMLLGEMFSAEIKGLASGMSILTNWIFAFVVTFSFPILTENLGSHITFYIIAGIMGIATIFVHYLVPETRGKTLQEIQEALRK
ncbi:unnamed protein product [Callosobruchus maculatus]|uniref:Major facilitator superfamily (MFS) profile domain-containing protein n=1 Tax=Callosobruchus maculatus TaxID=64391 RepID=A0A653BHB9_CALMS|nr:unnamed protein product [Callosobruchus maculatus]